MNIEHRIDVAYGAEALYAVFLYKELKTMSEPYIAYHYCTVETLQSILNSKVLWLCDLTDSNDDEEVIRTFVNLWDGVKKRLKETDIPPDVLESVIGLIDAQYKVEITSAPPYGICFCEDEDLLYQWKEYGDNTRGVSIGFDLNWFIRNGIKQQMPHPSSIQSHAIGVENVVYHSEKFENEMADLCYRAIQKAGPSAWITLIRPTFKHYSGFIKNPTFNPEKEIRIVYYPDEGVDFSVKDEDVSELKTNVKKHYEIPWVKIGDQALKSVCIGHNCKLTEAEIKSLLGENGLNSDVTVSKSKCSYRIRD